MDTMLLPLRRADKTIANMLGVGIAICLLASQNLIISAKDIYLNHYTGLSPNLDYILEDSQKKEAEFQEKILSKYSEGKIIEVEKGVKHVRMTKYYNNKPVRINIVELSTDVNSNLNIEPLTASKTLASKSKIRNIANKKNAIVYIAF